MSDKSDLKAELERKKQRLAQIREEKKRKEEERKKKEADMQQKKEPVQDDSDLDRKRRETEALLQSIGISPEPPLVQPLHFLTWDTCYFHYLVPTPMSPSSKSVSTPSEAGSQDSGDLGPLTRTLQWDTDPSVLQLQSDSELGRRLHRLGVSKVTQVDFLPREVVSYSKETQTPLATHQSEEDEEDEEMVEPKVGHDSELENQDQKQEVKEAPPRELTEEEKQQILHSEEFLIFFDRTIRVIERALAEDSDIFFDYSGRELEEKDGDVQAGANLSFNRQFYDEHWSKHRVVTCMDWSLQYPELMVASYNNNEDAPHEPDGVALVWNMKFKKTTPEYVFHCQSSVMSVCFARFHPNLVVGGTYSGQIVLWDNRSHRRTPVQRTPLSAAAHTHPVYCVNVVGTQNAHNLITVSTDGKMCSWSLDMLSTPQESMELVYNKSKPVAVTGMAFPTGDVNNFVVGSEEGTVYTACRHGSKAGIGEVFEGHQGPVTGINCHMAVGPIDFSHLFVTSSFDWTVKLWTTKFLIRLARRPEAAAAPPSLPGLCLQHNKPLYSFEDNADYVYDVMWSPVHPALFACVDGMGRLDLWNLNNDTEVPTASVAIEGASALNRVRWAQAGKEVAVGDSEGRIWIYDVGELAVPHNDEWTRFARTLVEIRANRADSEEEGTVELSA
ncbi:cytoplasmic dynein 1 intermediate chain 1 isoform X1 [Canis lupus baileyi]|uniref:cytoplasmic dynein 1 intermediate chain 1 isoform X1 n=1 Tax=Canis lupus familiaris TaxID=9615 RepID=UPI0003AD9ABC|nr:cytoplasmic dynein 1 intermediate chain 1 isoform X1 [Canis lupus familiaris]XP_025327081.1 cytoplasmic dynein 1 intermediate chain 1 isoform X1 [Canis lupus dingo]XP_035554389.1 cytoplasmic dynein 1 intermediate chain 1 isoform X1 [Canis lupus dingo]XP_035554391.1 cytoplasmic dynein 1 intermediate chain 1 isoform X1 [Canis lupus dingo]XP_038412795.1 cytoplasmic dynein 1 intermediate chain 1 isoform X1 [Canis lupus familiaris]XP_038542426.1 cytoplasmic dynein 1 intermediate chain 1 isoform |eukprot:XP_005628583.1 cytoplasmic dynein 1 intermediate chain 1 isoform X1 [Canis lupus familiaris]